MSTNLNRRGVLQLFAGGAAALCPVCSALAAETGNHAAAHPPHWEYKGAGGPSKWGDLQSDYQACSLGHEQSPINLHAAKASGLPDVDIAFGQMPLKVLNNGHTIQVNCTPGSGSVIGGERYELVQFHFHHPSEHILDGTRFELECHFVHRSASGALAVIGVFMRPGKANPEIERIWKAMPAKEAPEIVTPVQIAPAALLPQGRSYFRYAGSLTTPPCSEGVMWTVLRNPVEVSADQIRRFAKLFPVNARPIQKLNARDLLEKA